MLSLLLLLLILTNFTIIECHCSWVIASLHKSLVFLVMDLCIDELNFPYSFLDKGGHKAMWEDIGISFNKNITHFLPPKAK